MSYPVPNEYNISTMTITSKINGLYPLINIEKLYEYTELDEKDVATIKYLYDKKTVLPEKKKRKNSTKKKVFYNQLTIVVYIAENNYMNIKLFSNGKIQITGCKSLADVSIGLNKLIKNILLYNIDNIFTENKELTYNEPVVEMINSNFNVNFSIDLSKLYYILDKKLRNNDKYIIAVSYESLMYPGINLKFANLDEKTGFTKNKYNQIRYNKKISLFIFSSGNIIITGANNHNQINLSYNYINNILKENYSTICN